MGRDSKGNSEKLRLQPDVPYTLKGVCTRLPSSELYAGPPHPPFHRLDNYSRRRSRDQKSTDAGSKLSTAGTSSTEKLEDAAITIYVVGMHLVRVPLRRDTTTTVTVHTGSFVGLALSADKLGPVRMRQGYISLETRSLMIGRRQTHKVETVAFCGESHHVY